MNDAKPTRTDFSVCHCGEWMDAHTELDNHSPVEMSMQTEAVVAGIDNALDRHLAVRNLTSAVYVKTRKLLPDEEKL